MYRTGAMRTAAEVAGYQADHDRQRLSEDHARAQAAAECARLVEAGRALWSLLMPAGCTHVIVAKLIHDDSDPQTDYFGEHTEETVILAPSKHGRDNFAEMRKAAALLPETQHLGPQCDAWRVMVKAAPEDEHNRTWRGCLHDETGREWWATEAAARAEMEKALAEDQAQNDAVPFVAFCPRLPWGAELRSESIEHREKYSMGKGYYLQADRCNPWRVCKIGCVAWEYDAATGNHKPGSAINPEMLRALALRHAHLEPRAKAAPAASVSRSASVASASAASPATLTENAEKGGLEIRFPAKPAAATLAALKANGWRWSKFSGCWWIKASDTARQFAARIVGNHQSEIVNRK
jgi:hypothetical protein